MNNANSLPLIIIRGAGDLASGVAYRLFQSGFPVIMLETARPTVIRRTVSFAEAVFSGAITVEGVTAIKSEVPEARKILLRGKIPLIVDPDGRSIREFKPKIIVDAIMAKKNTGTMKEQADLVIALGPGFVAGLDAHAVIETMRGHYLGRVIWQGSAIPNTGIPGKIGGYAEERLIRANCNGIWQPLVDIGKEVGKGETVAMVDDTPIMSSIGGIVRGLLYPGLKVFRGMKVGDIDPRADREHCFTFSDKSRAVAGGVLEAVMHGIFYHDNNM